MKKEHEAAEATEARLPKATDAMEDTEANEKMCVTACIRKRFFFAVHELKEG
jgi:hypothetical protein